MATQIGVITAVVGTVTATAEDGSIRTLQAGDRVYANEVISTGPAGAVEIEFADGSVMDLGRNSQAMLDTAVFNPDVTELAETQGESVPDDVAAIQQAILEGEDPTVAGEATAAGAGVEGSGGGHDAVFVDYLNPEVTPEAGFDTIGVNSTFDEIEEEQLIDGVPTAGITEVILDEDDLITDGQIDLSDVSADFLAYLNSQHGVDAFGFDSPAGVDDERTELGDDTGSPDGHFLGGSLVANFGLNGPSETDPIIFNVTSGSDVTDSTGNPVTSQGHQVKYWVSADGLTVIGYIVDGGSEGGQELSPQLTAQQEVFDGCQGSGDDFPEMAEIIFTAQMTPNADGGSFLVGIFGQFDHAAPDYENGEFVFENNLFLNLGFTITDADGDSATGTLQINVDDDSPIRAGDEEQGLATQTGTVVEDGLSFEDGDLSEGNPNNASVMLITSDESDANQSDIEGFLGLSAGALEPAVDSNGGAGNSTNGSAAKTTLTVEAGDIISFNWVFNNGESGSEALEYNDFAFVVINGEVIELADSSAGNLASNPFTYEVTADGEITIGFGQMNVGDTGVDSSLSVSDLTLNGNTVNGGFDGSLTGWDTLGTVDSADSLISSDAISGNLNNLVNMGADVPGSFALLQASENEVQQALFQAGIDSLPTLSSKGEAVSYSVQVIGEGDDAISVLTASAGEGEEAREVFTLTIYGNGQWEFDLNDQLDHVAGETAEENFSLITLDENGEPNGSVDSIDFSQLLQIRDFDGDQLIITEDDAGMFTISIKDDIPVATEETVSFTVDEDDINTVLSDGNEANDSNGDGSFTGHPLNPFDNGPANVTGSVASLVSFGADEVGTFTLSGNLDALLAQNLTSQGDELSFSVDGNVLTAEADGREIFTLTLEANGDFTFELNDQLDHAEANGENNLPLDLSSLIVATDADGDAITLESGFVINITDDVPEQDGFLPDVGFVEEEALPAGNQEENDASIFGFPIDGWPDTAVATGSLVDQVSVGADENVTFSLSDDLSSLIAQNLTSGETPLSYSLEGNVLTASAGDEPVFTLSLADNGDYIFTLVGAIDHSEGNGENLQSINFSSIIEATDFDGDTITLNNDFFIKIVDDVPVANEESVSVTVDEDDINTGLSDGNQPNDSNGDGSFTGQPLNPFDNGPANVTGSVASLVSFGADGAGTFTLSNNFDGLLAQNLTSQGDDLTFSVDGNVLTAEADGRDVFTLTLETNGEFKFELHDQLDHAEANGENNLPLNLSSAIVATDADGDSITLESGFVVNVTDDVPEQDGLLPDVGIVEEEALPTGNQEINDSSYTITLPFIGTITIPLDGWPDTTVATGSLADQVSVGADEPASFELSGDYTSLIAQNLTSDGEPLTYALDGNTLYAVGGQTPVFTLSLNTEGDYTFTLMGPIDHAEGDGENLLSIDFSGIVNAEDFDGDSLALDQDFYIKIVDDVPVVGDNTTVRLDDDALDLGNPGGPGDQADSVNVSGTLSYSFGADGGSISWLTSGAPNGFSYEADGDNLLVKQDGTTVLTLTLDPATGDYTVTQNAPIDHKDNGNNNENNQKFDIQYVVEDADGDTVTGAIRVNVDDDTPVIGEQLTATVDDEGLVDGIEDGPNDDITAADETTFSGSLNFSTGADQPGSVDFAAMNGENATVGTETVSFSWDSVTNTLTATGPRGPLFTVEVTDTASGDYTVTLLDNVLHESLDGEAGDNTENNTSVDLEFTVTDNDGDSQTGNLTVDFDDDTPVVTSQQINLLTESFENFAPDLTGNNWTVVGEGGGTIIGNNGIEWTVNGAGIEIQSGNVGGASASDGDVHAELDAHDSNGDGEPTLTVLSTDVDLPTPDATLSFDFQPRPDDVDGSDMAVSLGGQTVNINVDGAGVIDFDSLPAGVSASQSSSAGGWTTITLTFTGLDTSSAQTLSFEGVGSENTLGAYIDNISLDAVASLTVDESALADGNGEAGASTTASFDFSGFFSGEFGADGPAGETSESYSLSLNGQDVASGLYTVDNSDTASDDGDGYGQGTEIVLNEINGEIIGSAGGTDYFTISVNAATGEVTLTQLENVWHADTTNPDDSQGIVLDAELLSLVKTLTDADGDSAEATLDLGGVSFNFEDDAPAIAAEQPTQPYLLTVTNEGGDAGYNNTYGFYIKGDNGEPVSGEIIWANVKNNTSEEITVEVTDPSDIGFFIIPNGADLNDLNNGDAVTFEQDGDGNWQVLLDGEPLTGQGTNVLFDNADLNPDNAEAVEDNAATGNQNWEDIIGGDNDFNDVNINVSISQLGAITVDETDIGNGDPSNATATLDLSGSFTPDFGADGPGDVDYGLSVNTDVETGLVDTLSGEDVELRVNGDGDVEGFITMDGSDEVVFTVSVDDDGEVTLTQLRAVEHDDMTDPDEANSPATLNAGAIALTGTVTDADGDSAEGSIDVGVLFAFEDDGPVAVDDADTVVESIADGNVVTADSTDGESGVDSYGADGVGSVTSITFGDTTVEVPADGSVEIEGDYGTLTMNSDGSYTYTTDPDSLPQNTETVEGWTNSGSNMTAFNLGESFLTADGKFSDTGSGTVTTGGNAPGFGVGGTSAPNTNVPDQINYSGSQSEALAFKFDGTVTSATVQFSNMFQNENGGEAMRWHAFDADGNRIGSGIVSDNENASDPYANSTDVTFDNNNIGSFTLSDIGAFSTLVFEGVPYSDDGSAGSDDSDFFVNVTSYEVFNSEDNAYQDEFGYTIVDGDGDSASATLTLNGNSEPQEGQLEPAAPVAADNTYQVDDVTTGNIITDDDDNGGAETGRDYDNDTPVINLSINSVIFNGNETFITEDNTEIELDNGTLSINLDGSYTYTPAQDADGGDEFDYTLVDPDGEVSEPATVTLLEPLVSDVVTLGDVTVNEGNGTATITGSVENPVTGSPLVISLSNGASITIPVGDNSAESTPFSVQGDDPYLDGESYTIEVTGTTGGDYSSLDTSDDATVTISDTIDTTTVTLDDVTVAEDGTITYSASVDNAPQGSDLTITLNNDVVITIPDGATSGSSAPQAAQGDDVYVDADSFNVSIDTAIGGNYEQLDTTDTATVTINDTIDTVTATLTASPEVLSENGGDITYTINLTGGPGDVDPDSALTFTLDNDGPDGNPITITVNPGATSGSVTVTYAQDDLNGSPVTNNIATVTGGSEYENLVTAGETSVGVDSTPEITNLTPQAEGGDASVDEDDLEASRGADESAGTDGSDSTTATGSFTINAADGVGNLTVGGQAVITNGAFAAVSFTTPEGNSLSFTGYNAVTGEVSYEYTLNDNTTDHGFANNGQNNVYENFDVVLTDSDGDSDTDTLSVQIVDDVPVTQSAENTLEVPISEVTIGDFVSFFTNVNDGDNVDTDDGASDGLGGDVDEVEWGDDGDYSNYTFDAALSDTVELDVDSEFLLGTFTHNNFSIPSGSAIDSVDLDVSFTVEIDGVPTLVEHTISFEHNETSNNDDPFSSRDIITISNDSTTVDIEVGGRTYQFQILGFEDSEGNPVNSVKTFEDASNQFNLIAKLSSTDDLPSIEGQVEAVFGAEGPADDASISWETGQGADNAATSGDIQGAYGVLTVDTEGNYSYVVDRDVRDNLEIDESLQEAFTYYTTDADGDRVENTLTINVDGTPNPAVANNDTDNAVEQSVVMDGETVASFTVEGWSDTSETETISVNDSIDPSGPYLLFGFIPVDGTPDSNDTAKFDIAADVTHPAEVSVDVDVSGFRSSDVITVSLFKDGESEAEETVVLTGGRNFSETVTFDSILESGDYFIRLFGDDNDSRNDLEASLSNLKVTSFNYGQNTITNTVNNAAIVAALAATGNVLANDVPGTNGIELKSVDGTEVAASGDTTINGLYGDLVITKDGDYTYTPYDGNQDLPENAAEEFEYTIIDLSDNAEQTATLTIDVNNVDYTLDGGDNVAMAENGGQTLDAQDGDDVLIGSEGNDILMGGAGNDHLQGMEGDDTLIGGAGNDILTGGAGADIFQWNDGDDGTTDNPAVDFVTDFNAGEGDVLNLADLLDSDGSKTIDDTNLDNYLKATFDAGSNQTKIDVYTGGDANSGGESTQSIFVNGNQQDLTTLLNNNNLNVDQS